MFYSIVNNKENVESLESLNYPMKFDCTGLIVWLQGKLA